MNARKFLALVVFTALCLNMLTLQLRAQSPQPIQITFGQPNIWSLEQAHYLLSQMHERSLGINAKKLTDIDPNSAEGARINLVRQLFGLSGEFKQSPQAPAPTGSPSPAPTATPLPSPVPFPSPAGDAPNPFKDTVLGALLGDKDFLAKLGGDSKLNATTQLDNHIQLQYEIIAKQLTLLRDEVGPDERLVFLELPQSIYASASETKDKVVQTYWEVAGYSTRPDWSTVLETINNLRERIQELQNSPLFSAMKADQRSNKEQEDLQKEIEKLEAKINTLQYNLNKLIPEKVTEEVDAIDKTVKRLQQKGSRSNKEIVTGVLTGKDQIQSAFVEGNAPQIERGRGNASLIRAIDIIPRQSSLNVVDRQETAKSTILSGAFSFLFGLGLRTNFQRQRDLFEQFLHQEIYASGFGKGENTFGWTFGPLPGTKRIAPGIRTTYAVVIVPRDAESLVVNARGCYFPRKSFQPEINDLGDWRATNKRECTQNQQFILPVPSGGDRNGFWVTGIDYSPVEKGKRIMASINGEDFTSQVGVLVNGVPLRQVVELTRKLPGDAAADNCDDAICGKYEVIDSNEITINFKMPPEFEGTPEITVIGPGRSVSLNRIHINVKVGSADSVPNALLEDVPYMMGERSVDSLSITGLSFFPKNNLLPVTSALLSGTQFNSLDEISVNGAIPNHQEFISKGKYLLEIYNSFLTQDTATVIVRRCRAAAAGTIIPMPACNVAAGDKIEGKTSVFPIFKVQFAVTSVTVLSFDKAKNEMYVRVEGSGLDNISLSRVNGVAPSANSVVIPVSSRELLVRITQPDAAVKITLKNPDGNEVNAVLVRPADPAEKKP
jgi:hypothetical protein